MAFDKRTGRRAWVSQCKDATGQTGGATLITVSGIPCVAVFTISHLVVVRLDRGHEGETLAAYPFETQNGQNTVTPAVAGDIVLLSSGLDMDKTVCLRVTTSGITKLWEGKATTRVCCPIVHRGRIYMAYESLKCVDLATGETRWTGGSFGEDASFLLTRDEKLIVFGRRKLALVDIAGAAADSYHELALRPNVGALYSWPHVVLAEGRLLAKDDKGKLQCFVLSK
jgi:outer membrane protein assembly factor BamB